MLLILTRDSYQASTGRTMYLYYWREPMQSVDLIFRHFRCNQQSDGVGFSRNDTWDDARAFDSASAYYAKWIFN